MSGDTTPSEPPSETRSMNEGDKSVGVSFNSISRVSYLIHLIGERASKNQSKVVAEESRERFDWTINSILQTSEALEAIKLGRSGLASRDLSDR